MELNITLCIQIVNFFIAWLLLHVLCFKPAIQYMQTQQKASAKLLEAIAIWQARIAQKEYDINTIWCNLHLFVQHHKPDIARLPSLHIDYDQRVAQEQVQSHGVLIQTLKDIVVTGITNDQ